MKQVSASLSLVGGLVKGFSAATFQQPKLKPADMKSKDEKDTHDAEPGTKEDDFKENSPPNTIAKRTRARERATRGPARPVVEYGRPSTFDQEEAAVVEPLADEPPQKLEARGGHQPAKRVQSRPASQRNSLNNSGLRTGDQIWELNLQLGRLAEQLADPEDRKQPGARRHREETLQEKLRRNWNGTYAQKLEREIEAGADEEEEPLPKYEPPAFLRGKKDAEDDMDVEPPSCTSPGDAVVPDAHAQPAVLARQPKAPQARAAREHSGKRTAQALGGKKSAGPVKQIITIDEEAASESMEDEEQVPVAEAAEEAVTSGTKQSKKKQQAEAAVKRAGRKGKGAVGADAVPATQPAEAPAESAVARAGAGAHLRAAGRANRAAAAPAAREQESSAQPDAGLADAAGPSTAAAAGGARGRKSHLPSNVNFGQPTVKATPRAPLPPVSVGAVSDPASGTPWSTAEAAPSGAAAAAAKRPRETAALGEDKARQAKAVRLEQQQAKELETLRTRNADLEQRHKDNNETIKQLQGDLKKQGAAAEKDRTREAGELKAAQKEVEMLQAELTNRDEKVCALKEEVKQSRVREKETAKRYEGLLQTWMAEDAQRSAQRQAQLKELAQACRT